VVLSLLGEYARQNVFPSLQPEEGEVTFIYIAGVHVHHLDLDILFIGQLAISQLFKFVL